MFTEGMGALAKLAQAADDKFATLAEEIDRTNARMTEFEARVDAALSKMAARTGHSKERLTQLLDKIIELIDHEGLPAPKGSTQDDGEPTNKPAMVLAQSAELETAPLAGEGDASHEGVESQAVVEAAGEASTSPAVYSEPEPEPAHPQDTEPDDEPAGVVASDDLAAVFAPAAEPASQASGPSSDAFLALVAIEGRTVHGPRASVMVSKDQAAIVSRLLKGAAYIGDFDNGERNVTLLRIANMKQQLRDAGIDIVSKGPNWWLAEYTRAR